jgi:hypothetical protein
LLYPFYLTVFSAVLLLTHLLVRAFWPKSSAQEERRAEPRTRAHAGILEDTKRHIRNHGGLTIYLFKVLRLVGCLALLGITIAAFIISEEESGDSLLDSLKKKHKKKHRKVDGWPTPSEWTEIFLCITYVRPCPKFSSFFFTNFLF